MKELGLRVGLSESAIYTYEVGKRKPDYEMMIKLSNVLDCPMNELAGQTSPDPMSKGDQMLFNLLHNASEEDKIKAANIIKAFLAPSEPMD